MSRFAVVDVPIAPDALLAAVADPRAGASVLFLGTTRNVNVGRRVLRLEYEAYGRMAVKEMRALAGEARRRWPLRKVAMVHRIGVVPIGEASVGIAVSGGHRTEAFEACHWLIDRLKEIVPIWKKEHFRGGTVWIGAQQGGPSSPRRAARTAVAARVKRRR
ncbi:MAG: molybdenum cofactor biosynthesis protein MoaE [bacterium]|nr:molybdenum cofactor biosynthesis protein MoaE [bacterium]